MGRIDDILEQVGKGRFSRPRLLGRGAMGLVYRVFDSTRSADVAVKLMSPLLAADEKNRARFLSEATLLERLHHPAYPELMEIREKPSPMFVMELIVGRSLREVVRNEGPQSVARVSNWLVQTAEALGAAHELGVVHRDVKPENILVQGDDRIRLIDLGVAADTTRTRKTQKGLGVGTPAFASPEQARGDDPTPTQDIYSLGATGCFLLTGHPPRYDPEAGKVRIPRFPHDSEALAHAICGALGAAGFARTESMVDFVAAIGGGS
jgi:serine/threonine protein kinase